MLTLMSAVTIATIKMDNNYNNKKKINKIKYKLRLKMQ